MSIWQGLMANPGAMVIAAVGLQYSAAMTLFGFQAQPWAAVTYLGYAIGNVGLTMNALGHR